jgi:hypothetical protein
MYFNYNIQPEMVETICTDSADQSKRRLDTIEIVPDVFMDDCIARSSCKKYSIAKSKRGVRFSAHLSYSHEGTSFDDETFDSLWYNNGDYERFRNENKIIVRFAIALYRSNCVTVGNDETADDREETICVRGLEHKVYEDFHETCRSSRKRVVTAVLSLQQRQRMQGTIVNEQSIRKGSIKFSRECKQLARTLGKMDANNVSWLS